MKGYFLDSNSNRVYIKDSIVGVEYGFVSIYFKTKDNVYYPHSKYGDSSLDGYITKGVVLNWEHVDNMIAYMKTMI